MYFILVLCLRIIIMSTKRKQKRPTRRCWGVRVIAIFRGEGGGGEGILI